MSVYLIMLVLDALNVTVSSTWTRLLLDWVANVTSISGQFTVFYNATLSLDFSSMSYFITTDYYLLF